ncbi:MAG: hypothetical protein WBD27_13485 [Pyrinomonadaceae bacterium]
MNRTFKTLFLTGSLLAVLFTFSASLSNGAAAMSTDILDRPSQCQTSPLSMAAGKNIFLSTSNSMLAAPAARVFEGCWTFWPSGPCRAIFRTGSNYEICGQCDASGNPGSGRCSRISIQTLNIGYWCS